MVIARTKGSAFPHAKYTGPLCLTDSNHDVATAGASDPSVSMLVTIRESIARVAPCEMAEWASSAQEPPGAVIAVSSSEVRRSVAPDGATMGTRTLNVGWCACAA